MMDVTLRCVLQYDDSNEGLLSLEGAYYNSTLFQCSSESDKENLHSSASVTSLCRSHSIDYILERYGILIVGPHILKYHLLTNDSGEWEQSLSAY